MQILGKYTIIRYLDPEGYMYQEGPGTSIPTLRVHVPNNWVLGFWVIVIIVQVLGKYMIIGYLDPYGYIIPVSISLSSFFSICFSINPI